MGRIVPDPGTSIAQAIINLANIMISDEGGDYQFSGISRNQTSGFHIANYIDDRRISILNHHVTDGFILVYGKGEDFEYPSYFAKDSATRVRFELDEIHLGARAVCDWLEEGTLMYPDTNRVE